MDAYIVSFISTLVETELPQKEDISSGDRTVDKDYVHNELIYVYTFCVLKCRLKRH